MSLHECFASLGIDVVQVSFGPTRKVRPANGRTPPNAFAAILKEPFFVREFAAAAIDGYPAAASAPRIKRADGTVAIIARDPEGNVRTHRMTDGSISTSASLLPLPGGACSDKWEVEPTGTVPDIKPADLMPPERPIPPSNHRAHPMSATPPRPDPMSAMETARSYVRGTARGHENIPMKGNRDLFNSSRPDEMEWEGWWSDEIDEWGLIPLKAPMAEHRTREMTAAVFKLARRLKGIGCEGMSREQLKPAIETWVIRIRRIPGWERVTVAEVMVLLPPWDRIKLALGTKATWWAEVTTAAEMLSPPFAVKSKFPNDACKLRLAMLCEAAAIHNGHRAFVLTSRKTGEFIGCKKTKAAKLLNLFVKMGWLKQQYKGRYRHGGSRFVWTIRRESCDFDSAR